MADDEDAPEFADQEMDAATAVREPKASRSWQAQIKHAQSVFNDWHDRCDNIDARYADLKKLAGTVRDRELQLFWANIQVLGPSTYSRPPVPVIVTRFKDRKPVPRAASELLERSSVVAFDLEDIDQVMRSIRDDLNLSARGVPWVSYEVDNRGERVCIEHLDRKDFLHEPAREWKEVGWVARCAWMTRKEMRKRFRKSSKNAYQDAAFEVRKEDKDNGAADEKLKAGVWEIWSKDDNRVVWVTEGVDVFLDEQDPFLTLEGFFPCPRPAYGTLQRRSLIPVPDMIFYKDQLEEINELTARISSLAEAVKVRGFYPAGASEIGEAVESALKSTTNNQVLVGISNWALVGGTAAKDMIVWLPLDMIVTTIAQLVTLRKQLIDDVYQITGLSDIMRGSTQASETATAQQLKAQYGSVRVRDRQAELVRVARDVARIAAEIMAENFSAKTLLAMSQMELPTDAEIKAQVAGLKQHAEQMMAEAEQAGQPEAMQQAQGQMQALAKQAQQLAAQPTIDKVMALLRAQRIRPFVLDIETDSTIQPDEDAEKKRRNEFLLALGQTLQQLTGLIQASPQAAPFAGQVLKFAVAPYRAGRELEQAIDEFVETMVAQAQQPKQNPEEVKAQQEMFLKRADLAIRQQEAKDRSAAAQADVKAKALLTAVDANNRRQESQRKLADMAARRDEEAQRHRQEMEKGTLELESLRVDLAGKLTPAAQATEAKAPSESINYKDLPPAGRAQMAAHAGIELSPEEISGHQAELDAAAAAAKAAAKPQPGAQA